MTHKRWMAVMIVFAVALPAIAATVFTDGFEDGNHTLNPTWQILTLAGVNESHANRWTTSGTSPITGSFSELWNDQGCVAHAAFSECFPLGLLYHEPTAGDRPRDLESYSISIRTRLQDNGPTGAHLGLEGYASGTGVLMWPTQTRGGAQYTGGFAAGLFFEDPTDPASLFAGILFVEAEIPANVAEATVNSGLLIEIQPNLDPANFFDTTHDIVMTVRQNRWVELTIDGQYYGQADASDPTLYDSAPTLTLADMEDVVLAGLAENTNRYDNVRYDDAPPKDANLNGVPDVFETCPDFDGDGIGDRHDPDDDEDGTPDYLDTPVSHPDLDGDGIADECDSDIDNDGCGNGLDSNPDPTPPDCDLALACTTGGNVSHDCDGDGVANDCEATCATDPCDGSSFCDNTPPGIVFTQPRSHTVYVQDSMGVGVPESFGATTVSSITIEARITDPGSGVDPSSVAFAVDGEPVPAGDVLREPPDYSFAWDVTGVNAEPVERHEITVDASDQAGNPTSATTGLFVVDATEVTDGVASDVSDQYAVVIEPDPRSFGGGGVGVRNLAVLQPQNGFYSVRYRVEDSHWALGGTATTVQGCRSNSVHVGDLQGGVAGLTTPGAFPGFWHDPAFTVFDSGVACAGSDPDTSFSQGVYTVRIPECALAPVAGQPVYVWAYVNVPDRATTDSLATGPMSVDSASGFYNPGKVLVADTALADRLDEVPAPLFVVPPDGDCP